RQIPGQDDSIVRLPPQQLFGSEDGDSRPREKPPLLVRTPVHRERDRVGAQIAVVQQRVAFGRGAVTGDRVSCGAQTSDQSYELLPDVSDKFAECKIAMNVSKSRFELRLKICSYLCGDLFGPIFGEEHAQRAAVYRLVLDIDEFE